KHKQGDSWEGRGHCIDCVSCVVVCPMGIDIRNGLQYDCIGCGLCIHACNNVMDKIMLPRGLIHYDTENNQQARTEAIAAGRPGPRGRMKWIRPRTVFYAAIMSLVGSLMLAAIVLRTETEVNVIHNRSPLYVRLSSGEIRNNYQIKILNKTHFDRSYGFNVSGLAPKAVTLLGASDAKVTAFTVPANSVGDFRVELVAGAGEGSRTPITFVLKDQETGKAARHASYFIQP
ncbi:MAG: cytochrome c oxidase accessory protein CcoG, partial [Asticcacaulis sp.]|nr:cytochrome c oxidase accessory protein CcoG [Asticcacaulis sp.]